MVIKRKREKKTQKKKHGYRVISSPECRRCRRRRHASSGHTAQRAGNINI
jgi:hypothetical protein